MENFTLPELDAKGLSAHLGIAQQMVPVLVTLTKY